MVQRALISGVTPVFNCAYTFTGRVFSLGPFTKILITTSSKDMANASKLPDKTAGAIRGMVMSKKVLIGPAPQSLAASSRDLSIPTKRAFTIIKI